MKTDKENNESFVRWQQKSITQLGFANNLLMVVGTGLCAFQIDLLTDAEKKFKLDSFYREYFGASMIIIGVSVCIGLITVLIRVHNFRLTARIARMREKGAGKEIFALRQQSKCLGKATWNLFYLQVIMFIIGIGCLFYYFSTCYWIQFFQ